jgi:WD40 repeat protein
VLRSIKDPRGDTAVYTDYPAGKVTSAQFSPDSKQIATGDEKGKMKILTFNPETRAFELVKEHNMLTGNVNAIAWTDDSQRIAAAGEGKDMLAKVVLAGSGTK